MAWDREYTVKGGGSTVETSVYSWRGACDIEINERKTKVAPQLLNAWAFVSDVERNGQTLKPSNEHGIVRVLACTQQLLYASIHSLSYLSLHTYPMYR